MKSELIGFNVDLEPIEIEGTTIKFLGLTIEQDLNFDIHVNNISNKMRSAAGCIRAEGRHVSVSDRKILFNGWVRSIISHNALAFLPHLSDAQIQLLTTAYNSGIRAIFGLPKRGYAPISDLRSRLHIPSVEDIRDSSLFMAAWNNREHFSTPAKSGPTTRGRANLNVPLPDLRGMSGKLLSSISAKYWNKLPIAIKLEQKKCKAKTLIRNFVLNW